ncbi:MAG: cytochrome c [Phycisphaeraceae bacterium]|nr:cytochrome c [Phycisphaeraceae bacterium]
MSSRASKVKVVALTGAVVLAGVAGACRGDRTAARPRQFFPDMDDSPKFKPQTKSEFFTDSRSMRPVVEGTVAFGMLQDVGVVTSEQSGATMLFQDAPIPARDRFLREDDAYFRGINADGTYLQSIPLRAVIDTKALQRGQDRFNVFCASCHGYDGQGKGQVGIQWSYPLPNFNDPKYWDPNADPMRSRDGYIFHTIRNGVIGPDGAAKMPGYAYNITPADAWNIVAYFRALQASRQGKLTDLPEAERQRLLQLKTNQIAPTTAPATTPASSTPVAPTPLPPGHPLSVPPAAPAPAPNKEGSK